MDAANTRWKTNETRRIFRPALLMLAAFVAYALMWPAVPGDIPVVVSWLDHILAHGPIGAFAIPFSNYSPPYLYLLALVSPLVAVMSKVSLIKFLSVAGTIALALAVRHLTRSSPDERNGGEWLLLPLLPSVAVNAANFAQTDAMWSAACVMAVASAISERRLGMLAWFGVAVAFKAQALFLGPFVALRLVQTRTPWTLWMIPMLVYVGAMLPAALAGWPITDLATIYLRQAEWNPAFVSTAANPWSLAQYLAPELAHDWFWLGFLAAGAAALTFVAAYRHREYNKADMIALALLGSCLLPFFLPKMHERYFFLSEVLAFVLAISAQDRRSLLILCLVEAAWVLAIAGAIFNAPLAGAAGGAMLLCVMLLLIDRLRPRSAEARSELVCAGA